MSGVDNSAAAAVAEEADERPRRVIDALAGGETR